MTTTTVRDQKDQAEWDALLARESDSVPQVAPASYMKEGEILNRPSETNPLPLRVTSLRYKGYVEVWDTLTGEKSLQPWWLLWQTMKKKREDGTLVFTRSDPHIPPNYGADLTCPLNPKSPEYKKLKKMGFRDCKKQHIPHIDGLQRHVQKSHSRAWEAMERERETQERQEDRQLQRDMLAALTGAAVQNVAVPAPQPNPVPAGPLITAQCPKCQKEFAKPTQAGALGAVRFHLMKCQGTGGANA